MGIILWIKNLFFNNDDKYKRHIVHLGNIGKDKGEKTREYAQRFLNFRFTGIDLKEAPEDKPENWNQIEEEFVKGLNKIRNKTVDLISSELAVGHYEHIKEGKLKAYKEEYTKKIIKTAYNKLKSKGKIRIVVGDYTAFRYVENSLKKAGFIKIKNKKVNDPKLLKTIYMKKYHETPKTYRSEGLYEFTATKI